MLSRWLSSEETSAQWFTLVELIVVITIVWILSTIGFVSYSSYLTGARDSSRLWQLANLTEAMQVFSTSRKLPLPDNKIDITASGTIVAYQGYAGVDVLDTLDYTNGGKDPKDKSYFTYSVTKNRNSLQLLALMEEANSLQTLSIPWISTTHAVDYSERYPKTYGNKIGILTSTDTDTYNTPAQEVTWVTSVDLVNTTEDYIAHLSDTDFIEGEGPELRKANPLHSCKRVKQSGQGSQSWLYTINPDGLWELQVYCDMETRGGWWTLVHKTTDSPDNLTQTLTQTEWFPNWKNNKEYKLSIDYWQTLSTEAVMATNERIDWLKWNDITDGVITNISTSGVTFSETDTYRVLGSWTTWGSQDNCTDNSYYWNNPGSGCCARCINNDATSSYGSNKQPFVVSTATSAIESAVEWAWWTNDSLVHVLDKMGIFIK